jgi:type IV pilus assembly protein PilW
MQENARYASSYIARIVRMSDFWSGIRPSGVSVGLNSISGVSGASVCKNTWVYDLASSAGGGLHGYDGGSTPPIDCIAAADYVPQSDVLVVRYVDPSTFAKPADVDANPERNYLRVRVGRDGYLYQGSQRSAADGQIAAGNGVLNYEYAFQMFFLRPCSTKAGAACSASDDGTPTLVSLQLSTTGVLTQVPLVDNIEQLQFEYGLDTNGDFVVDRYKASPTAGEWQQAISVRMSMIARGDAFDSFSDTRTYDMTGGLCHGPASSSCASKYTGKEKYQRRLIVKDIQLRNRTRL